jgi:bacillithiol system protein YtxJ
MNWNQLTDVAQLEEIKKESHQYPILILKHSTRCSISATTLGRLERNWKQDEVSDLKPYYLDLIAHRSISNKIAEEFDVWHESPQALIIRNGESIFDASHFDISFDEIKAQVSDLV